MLQYGVCPLCKNEIPEDRLYDTVVVCRHCGWSDNKSEIKATNRISRKVISMFVLFSTVISLSYVHTVNWGRHSLAIVPLKINEMANKNLANDDLRHAQICLDLYKYDCAETKYESAIQKTFQQDSKLEIVAKLAKLQELRDKSQLAMRSYGHYFDIGGKSSDLAHSYANLLDKLGFVDEAKKYFQYTLDSKPDVFQITVTKNYVTFLIKHNQLKEALSLLKETRKKGENAKFFMENEFKEIKKRLVVAAR